MSANSITLEGVDYATAVQVLRDSGQSVNLVVKRRVVLPAAAAASILEPHDLRVCLSRNKKKEDFGVVLGCKIYIKEITHRSVADKDGTLHEGDLVHKINGNLIDGLTLKEARKLLETSKDKLDVVVKRDPNGPPKPPGKGNKLVNGRVAKGGPYGDPAYNNPNVYIPTPEKEMNGGRYATPPRMAATEVVASTPPRPPLPLEEGKKRCIVCGFVPPSRKFLFCLCRVRKSLIHVVRVL